MLNLDHNMWKYFDPFLNPYVNFGSNFDRKIPEGFFEIVVIKFQHLTLVCGMKLPIEMCFRNICVCVLLIRTFFLCSL